MSWTPLSAHVSQLQYNPNTGGLDGRDDCGPASVVRVLREYGKIAAAGDRLAQIADARLLMTGLPDVPGQGGTSISEVEKVLAHYGISSSWSDSFTATEAATMAIVLIDAPPSPQQYPPSWLGGQSHWIVWLPQWNGQINWWNDPLAYNNHQADCQYDLSTVAAAFQGAVLLPALAAAAPTTDTIGEKCALKVQASHTSTGLAQLAVGAVVTDLGVTVTTDDTWRKVSYEKKIGWIPKKNIAA